MRPRQRIQIRRVTLLLVNFRSTYLLIDYHASFLLPRRTPHSFYQSLILPHSTFSSTGCISAIPNTLQIALTVASCNFRESQEMLHTWVSPMTSLANFSVDGNGIGENATCLLLLPTMKTRNLLEKHPPATRMWM